MMISYLAMIQIADVVSYFAAANYMAHSYLHRLIITVMESTMFRKSDL
jgi:hypothetical protein